MLGILADSQIRALCEQHKMIEPFEPKAIREVTVETLKGSIVAGGSPAEVGKETKKIISFGMSGYGYDIRVADDFKIFKNVHCVEIDPKKMDDRAFETVSAKEKGGFVHVPPNSFMLARSVEYFRIPRNVLAVVLGKSTYARCGIIVNCTPAEPEWEGHLTIEISNTTPLPARIYANEGIAQMLFYAGDAVCEVSYKEKNNGQPGKYQGQGAQIVLPKV